MPNKAYSEGPEDTKVKEGRKGDMKNVDGRLKGSEYNKQAKVPFEAKAVYNMPNEGAPRLVEKLRPGMDEGAY